VGSRAGIGPDHPDAVALRGDRWLLVTCAPWAARLPDWPAGNPADVRAIRGRSN
jgi:hypothetical protein